MARTVCYSQLNLTSDRLYDLMWFLCRLWWHIRFVEFGSFRNLIGFFSAFHVIFVTIKDLKYYLQPGPAYFFNSVAGCCVSHHGV